MSKNALKTSGVPPHGCPICDALTLIESVETEQVPYGSDGIMIPVEVPIFNCASCSFSFTDERAEALRHAAVCRYEGLLAPSEIKAVRSALNMSRREFGEAFGIPASSMERWENGKLIHSTSLDTLLRALQNKATAVRLDRRVREDSSKPSGKVLHFPALERNGAKLNEARVRGAVFRLRAMG